nr:MAG TPA: hypothetical protein [Caudoviricetes sp.]
MQSIRLAFIPWGGSFRLTPVCYIKSKNQEVTRLLPSAWLQRHVSYSLISVAKVAIILTQSKGFTVFDVAVTN